MSYTKLLTLPNKIVYNILCKKEKKGFLESIKITSRRKEDGIE